MFFKKKNDNNIDDNDKNVINIESVENNNNNNKKEKRKFKDSINKKYLKNGSCFLRPYNRSCIFKDHKSYSTIF